MVDSVDHPVDVLMLCTPVLTSDDVVAGVVVVELPMVNSGQWCFNIGINGLDLYFLLPQEIFSAVLAWTLTLASGELLAATRRVEGIDISCHKDSSY